MGNKLTGYMGYTLDWAHALEKRVTYGRKTTICQPAQQQAFRNERAVPGVRHQPKDRTEMGGPI